MYLRIYLCIHISIYVFTYLSMYSRIYLCTHVSIYVLTYLSMYSLQNIVCQATSK